MKNMSNNTSPAADEYDDVGCFTCANDLDCKDKCKGRCFTYHENDDGVHFEKWKPSKIYSIGKQVGIRMSKGNKQ